MLLPTDKLRNQGVLGQQHILLSITDMLRRLVIVQTAVVAQSLVRGGLTCTSHANRSFVGVEPSILSVKQAAQPKYAKQGQCYALRY